MVAINRLRKNNGTLTLPAGWKPLSKRLPRHVGGGILCEAPTAQLAEMVPDWNPSGRTDPDSPLSHIRSLSKSITTFGMGHFPIVTRTTVIEGNRRVRAALMAGWKTLIVTFRPWLDASAYADNNTEIQPHSPAQKAETWLRNPAAVSYGINARLMRAVELVGMDTVKWVTGKKMNVLSLLYWSQRAFEYCQPAVEQPKFLRKAVRHMARFNEQKLVRDWVTVLRGSPVQLFEAIMAGKRLKPHC